MTAFITHLNAMLQRQGGKLFANLADGPLTYAACWDAMQGHQRVFADLGLLAGDRVLVISGNDRATITVFLALLHAGLTPVIADRAATLAECDELLALCLAHAVICDADHPFAAPSRPLAQGGGLIVLDAMGQASVTGMMAKHPSSEPADIGPNPIALLVLTSGTTSTPKAVALTHANLAAQMEIFREVYGFDTDTRLLNPLPLHHVDGLIRGPLAALWFGGSVHRPTPFSVQTTPDLLASISDLAITHLISVPAMLRILDRVGRDQRDAFKTPAFRFIISSADLLEPALWQRVEATFGVSVVNAYGLSEVVCDALFVGAGQTGRRIGTLGRTVGCTARVVDAAGHDVTAGTVGELVLSGPTVMAGYFRAPEITATVLENGHFYTGDYVRADAGGIFEFIGRKKTAIVSAGFTIHPETASQVLCAMPGVLEAVAFGVADTALGERLVAAIVPAPGHAITAVEASAYCRAHLSPERSPREFHIVEALPRGASGKVVLSDLVSLMQHPASPTQKADVLSVAATCFNVAVTTLSFSSTPFTTEGWDSLAHMTLIEALETAFDIQFSAMQIAQIMSLGDADRFVRDALASAGRPV